jgi:hypothetical protein
VVCWEAEERAIQSPTPEQLRVKGAVKSALRMRNIYEVLRQKELDVSRLQKEVQALRVAAPLLLVDGEAEDYHQPTISGSTAPLSIDKPAENNPQQAEASGWGRAKRWGNSFLGHQAWNPL